MKPIEIEKTKLSSVSCNGGEAPYDHPKVYLAIDGKIGQVECPYCSKILSWNKGE